MFVLIVVFLVLLSEHLYDKWKISERKKERKDLFSCRIITVTDLDGGRSPCSLSWSPGQSCCENSTLETELGYWGEHSAVTTMCHAWHENKHKDFTQELQRLVINTCWGVPVCMRYRNRHHSIYSVWQPAEGNIMSYFFDCKKRETFWRVLSPTLCYI